MAGRGAKRWALAALAVGMLAGIAPAAADVLDDALARGTLRLGYRLDAPPFSYADDAGRPAGLAVQLCAAAAPGLVEAAGGGIAVEWVPVTAAARFEALVEGRIDLLCGPTTQTLKRRASLDFSIPYYVDGAGIVFRKGGPEALERLTDEPVGVLNGTTTEALARKVLAEHAPGARLVLFRSHVEGLEALQRGDVEAYLGDQSILLYQLGRMRPTVQPVIARRMLSREPYALAMKRGESRLRLAIDRELSRIYESGAIYGLIQESLGRVQISPEIEAIYDVVAIPD
ncbi:amino acid ABC transporter substrate-binding protein [Albimonas pacifica]|uniref:Amino acid ABC transporter substrate-binding protein, PAAT family n=1 Tax=Albimonas pacifica TaxID=1114924 RepID=A0A1I3GZT7_9RHOB|nr:amino acid ABC transporter substrate-binding protein [Albimonas pacifica]SFI29004.1 amino acid ABC transporter substrate-binding protein, PAAT family [Albimonas pacifica]